MAERAPSLPITIEDYLEGELLSDIRHEYIDGEVYAMVGASAAHNIIVGNLFAALHAHLRGGPCQVFMADMKTHIQWQEGERFYYPDIQVCCDPVPIGIWKSMGKMIRFVSTRSHSLLLLQLSMSQWRWRVRLHRFNPTETMPFKSSLMLKSSFVNS